ncbi:hypothetical protein Tco_0009423 [Tanacetum coccineum]
MVDHALSHALTATADVLIVDVLQLLVETPKNPFIILADLKYIPRFLKIVGYEGIVDKKKDLISYPHFTKLIIDDHIKKFPSISLRLKEDYHSIKDDVPLGSVYTTGNMIKPSTTSIPPLSGDRERDEIAEATLLSLTMHKTAIIAEARENVVKVQDKILEEDIDKMIDDKDDDVNMINSLTKMIWRSGRIKEKVCHIRLE